jgi:hypothetical protein
MRKVAPSMVLRRCSRTGTDTALGGFSGPEGNYMRKERKNNSEEPVGIVISRGSRDEQEPRLTAYVWGPAPVAADKATRAA